MFGIDDGTGLYSSSFNGLKFPEGTQLDISGGQTVSVEFTQVDSSYSGRNYNEGKAVNFTNGNYLSGTDFPAGTYNLKAVSGTGNISSSNLFSGGINEMFGVNDGTGLYSPSFANVDLSEGIELEISGGVTVMLIPAE